MKYGLKRRFILAVTIITFPLLFLFQNCGKTSMTGSGDGGIAKLDTIPPEDQPPLGGPPSTGGVDAAPGGSPGDGGGITGFNPKPTCFQLSRTQISSPEANTLVYAAELYTKLSNGNFYPTSASSGHLYAASAGAAVDIFENWSDPNSIPGQLYFLIDKDTVAKAANISISVYDEDYCDPDLKIECLTIPPCHGGK